MSDVFLKIPSSLIRNIELGEKRVIAYCSIILSNWSGVNYEELTTYSLYSSFRGKDGIVNQYKQLVSHFFSAGYFEKVDKGIFNIDKDEQFSIVYISEIQKIFNLRKSSKQQGLRLNHANVLLLLSYIRLYMNHGKGKPEYHSNLLVRISQQIGLSVRSISSSLKILKELEIIHNQELPRYKSKDGNWHSNVRIFVNMKKYGTMSYDYQQEVIKGIKYIQPKQIN